LVLVASRRVALVILSLRKKRAPIANA